MAGIIVGAINGHSKEKIHSCRYCPVSGYWDAYKLPKIDETARGSFKYKNPLEIAGRGYVVKSLEAALWAFYNSDNFEDNCLLAVNLGDDVDTIGAVYGQITGDYYGKKGIPAGWRNKLVQYDLIRSFADRLIGIQNKCLIL